jgi:hypothetical protein
MDFERGPTSVGTLGPLVTRGDRRPLAWGVLGGYNILGTAQEKACELGGTRVGSRHALALDT